MDMQHYLKEVEYAATAVIELVWREHDRLRELNSEAAKLRPVVEAGYHRADAILMNAEDPDDVMMGVGTYWETYFEEDKQLHGVTVETTETASLIAARDFSTCAQSGSLIQYGKQGISMVYHGLAACKDGRIVGSQPLKNVIWQARNHALHWEDRNPHPPVKQCFDILAAEFDPAFGEYLNRNLGFEVVKLLGWKNFSDFEKDMLTLA